MGQYRDQSRVNGVTAESVSTVSVVLQSFPITGSTVDRGEFSTFHFKSVSELFKRKKVLFLPEILCQEFCAIWLLKRSFSLTSPPTCIRVIRNETPAKRHV